MTKVVDETGQGLEAPIETWEAAWARDCPLMIAVAFSGWERGSDAALRDELKCIRETGFTAVRVRFDRDNDIEKSAGMMNWRNPDRFFDSADKAGLKVIAAPGNLPHVNFSTSVNFTGLNVAAMENVGAWLKKFCGQYSAHPALLAWELESSDVSAFDASADTDFDRLAHITALLAAAFQTADPAHPVIRNNSNLLAMPYYHPLITNSPDAVVGTPFWLDLDLEGASNTAFNTTPNHTFYEVDRPIMAMAQLGVTLAGAAIPIVSRCTSGTLRHPSGVPSQGSERVVTMTEGLMTRLLLLFLAAGMRSITLDRWKPDRYGEFAGERSLVDWLDRVTPHGLAAGRVARGVETYRQELWRSTMQPRVQILWTPDNDPRTYLGASRVLLNANIPFTFVSENQFLNGGNLSAPILFLPGIQTLTASLLEGIKVYAEKGGRVVADMPTGCLNERGELLDTRSGTPFEQLFGASIAGLFCIGNPGIKESVPERQYQRAYIVTTTAKAGGGADELPAFTENRVGKGRAVLVNMSLSRMNAEPALQNSQLSLLSYLLGSRQTNLPGLTDCLIFRRTAEQIEHLFLINDSNAERSIELPIPPLFTQAHDVIETTELSIENNTLRVTIPAGFGRWLRLSK